MREPVDPRHRVAARSALHDGPLATVRVADARPPAARVSRNDAVIADLAYVGDASFAFEDVVVRALKSLSAKVAAATR